MNNILTKSQKNIQTIVKDYKWMFSGEYKMFLEWIKEVKNKQNNDFATVKNPGENVIQRKLGEMPETLHAMFQKRLDTEDREYLNSTKGSHWFFKTFKEFRVTKEI